MAALHNKRVLAIIPARKGSKRLPGKNIKVLGDKPLINWTIDAILAAELDAEVFVSTDCQATQQIALAQQLSCPFLRPEEIAGDQATAMDVINHTLAYYQSQQMSFDYVLWLQPTSPLRSAQDIKNAMQLLDEKQLHGVISVTPCEHSPLLANQLSDDHDMSDFLSELVKANSQAQQLPPYYRLNGAIYIADRQRLLAEQSLFLSSNIAAYVMANERSVDIDNLLDFQFCEFLLAKSADVQ